MKLLTICMVMLLTIILLSCGTANNDTTQEVELNNIAKQEDKLASNNAFADTSAKADGVAEQTIQAGQPAPKIDWDKKIIKTANITVDVKDYNSYNAAIHGITKRYGAYIASEQQNEYEGKIQNVLSIKVPVEMFEDLMNGLPSDKVKVIEKRISSEDVTGEVVDSKARIEARKQVRDRYLSLLKQAKNMKDILEVEQTINSVQEEIEAGTGRVKYLNHQAAYSTINLTYYQLLEGSPTNPGEPSFFASLAEAFKSGLSIISSLFLGLVTIWPLILSGFCVWFLVKRFSPRPVKLEKKEVEVTS